MGPETHRNSQEFVTFNKQACEIKLGEFDAKTNPLLLLIKPQTDYAPDMHRRGLRPKTVLRRQKFAVLINVSARWCVFGCAKTCFQCGVTNFLLQGV